MRVTCGVVLVMLAVAAPPAQAQTQTNTQDTQLWTQVVATVRLSESWRLHLEEQPRWSEDASQSYQIITRTALGRRVNARLTLWGGHAWIAKPPGPGVTHEQRVWEQASITLPTAAQWTPSVRVRLEQRFQDTWADSSHRLRVMTRAVRPLDADRRWSVAAWNEAFFTLDDTAGGPAQGVDQNRLFGGVIRQLHPKAAFEFGYMWNTAKAPGRDRTHAHVAFLWLNLAL